MQKSLKDHFIFLFKKEFWKTILALLVGVTIISFTINGIIIHNNFISGGFIGIAIIIYYITNELTVVLILLIVNIPMFIFGFRIMSLKFMTIAMIGATFFLISLQLTLEINFTPNDSLLAAIMAGSLVGLGRGIYLRYGGSIGGLDIIAQYIKQRYEIPIGTTTNCINIVNFIFAFILFDIDIALYSVLFLYVQSVALEKVQTLFSQRNSVLIISEFPEIITQRVLKKLDRGSTIINGTGSYTDESKKIIYTVISMTELGRLKELVLRNDPNAFIAIIETKEVIGKGFLRWEKQ